MPVSRGGGKTVPCCRQCNGIKGNMHPYAWAVFMAVTPEWWTLPEFKNGKAVLSVSRKALWEEIRARRSAEKVVEA